MIISRLANEELNHFNNLKRKVMKKENLENNLIAKLTFEFALDIIDYCKLLEEKKNL